jgi:zinc finger SWIM domain-containing protein 3
MADPDFYYDYQLDGNGRLRTMFWCDGQSRMNRYKMPFVPLVGMNVVFDSTYRMNRYKMPFVPFVGMNQHRSTTVFGCGIVSDEHVESFIWLLLALMKAMCQQKPELQMHVSPMTLATQMLPKFVRYYYSKV